MEKGNSQPVVDDKTLESFRSRAELFKFPPDWIDYVEERIQYGVVPTTEDMSAYFQYKDPQMQTLIGKALFCLRMGGYELPKTDAARVLEASNEVKFKVNHRLN